MTGKHDSDPPSNARRFARVEKILKQEIEDAFEKGFSFFLGTSEVKSAIDPGFKLAPGEAIADYRLEKLVGQGGMGQVWEAVQVSLDRKVALKVVRPERISERSLQLFAREARAGGRLSHPSIVTIFDHGESEGIHWIAMEFVEGNWTLGDFISEMARLEQLPQEYYPNVARFVAELAEALQTAHDAGVIHRDLKPQNVLITPEDHPKITDFGLAKITDETSYTRTGDFAGTYYYMSPEQVTAGRIAIDFRTDIFSLGVIFYEMLALRRPFEGDTTHQIAEQIVLHDPPSLLKIRSRIPSDLAVVCAKAMEKARERRYKRMNDFAADIRRHLGDEPVSARPPGPLQKAAKKVRRNPLVSIATGLVFLFLIVFSTYVALWSNPRITAERDKAVNARKKTSEALVKVGVEKDRAQRAEKNAKHQADLATEQARIAGQRYDEIIRLLGLSDVTRLENLADESLFLWPALPENAADMQKWLDRARELTGRLDNHREALRLLRQKALPADEEAYRFDIEEHPRLSELQELKQVKEKIEEKIASLSAGKAAGGETTGEADDKRSGATPLKDIERLEKNLTAVEDKIEILEREVSTRRTFFFSKTEDQWRHDMLAWLVSTTERFVDEEVGLYQGVEARHEFAATVRENSIGKHEEKWNHAIATIADRTKCPQYDGLVIEPQLGLVPIGRDPDSRLWEFAHIQTGEVPGRGPDGTIVLEEGMGLVFVLIPGGVFRMGGIRPSRDHPVGSPNVDPGAVSTEGPVHDMRVDPFFLSKYELTHGQWERFVGRYRIQITPSRIMTVLTRTGSVLRPEFDVNWEDVMIWCSMVGLRLPSESEWEYALRGGTTTPFYFGQSDAQLDGHAWYRANSGDRSRPVGGKEPNPFGLHDMLGNVWEWCADSWYDYSARDPLDASVMVDVNTPYRITRGGGWDNTSEYFRSACRSRGDVSYRISNFGFRPALTIQ